MSRGYNEIENCVLYPRPIMRWSDGVNFCCFICVTQWWALHVVIKRQFLHLYHFTHYKHFEMIERISVVVIRQCDRNFYKSMPTCTQIVSKPLSRPESMCSLILPTRFEIWSLSFDGAKSVKQTDCGRFVTRGTNHKLQTKQTDSLSPK